TPPAKPTPRGAQPEAQFQRPKQQVSTPAVCQPGGDTQLPGPQLGQLPGGSAAGYPSAAVAAALRAATEFPLP
ncbi:unnamed protein product, partial [Polarella glacialis]